MLEDWMEPANLFHIRVSSVSLWESKGFPSGHAFLDQKLYDAFPHGPTFYAF